MTHFIYILYILSLNHFLSLLRGLEVFFQHIFKILKNFQFKSVFFIAEIGGFYFNWVLTSLFPYQCFNSTILFGTFAVLALQCFV